MSKHITKSLSINYTLISNAEVEIFNNLLTTSNIKHKIFLTYLYQALGEDLNKMLRIVTVGASAKTIAKSALNELRTLCKESVILANYKKGLNDNGSISAVKLEKLDRFRLMRIKRLYINNVLSKHGII